MLCSLWSRATATVDNFAARLPDSLLLVIRLYWGWQFFVTGKGKLLNLDGTTSFFAELGLPVPKLNALAAGCTESVGGLLLLVGLASRLTAVPLICTMIVAYLTAHRETVAGIWQDSDAFVTAPPFLFLFASLLILIFGPGRYSVDARLRSQSFA